MNLKILSGSLIAGFMLIMISCQTNTCPNCVNPKPAYYNAEKAREARRLMRQSNKTTATGQTAEFKAEKQEKKGHVVRLKNRKNQKTTVNEPIL